MDDGSLAGETSAKKRESMSSVSGGTKKAPEPRMVRGTKAEVPVFERKNWLLHMQYIRRDFDFCKILIKEMLIETDDMCEYARYVLGMILRQEGEIQGSLEMFQQAALLNPSNVENIKQVARSHYLLGRHKASLDAYTEALKLSPSDWEILHNQGVCLVHLKAYDKAVGNLQKALELSPQTVTYMELGRVHLLKKDVTSALTVYKRAVSHSPENPEVLSTLGLLYLEQGQPQKAFECLGSALTYDPSNNKAILAAGCMMQTHGDYDVALSKYRVAAINSPESPQLWNNIAMCFFGKKKYVAAISCLKRANYLAPFEWEILYNLGLVHLTMQQYASSFHFFRAATAQNPKCAKLYMLLGVTLTHLEDHDAARQSYEQALSLDKTDPLIHLNYAVTLCNCGERRLAAKHFSQLEANLSNMKEQDIDAEVAELRAQMEPLLQVGEEHVRKHSETKTESNNPPIAKKRTKKPTDTDGNVPVL
ncbi:Bardet-Biedl syndrome 4 protein-like [Dysidea avara]|uniref:Bardet-Biedl syndrome 4 protein-like n=1 Tax=Dysidea avara TaxID=196820 RepID=UPI00332F1464